MTTASANTEPMRSTGTPFRAADEPTAIDAQQARLRATWAKKIQAELRYSVDAVLRAGRALIEAKEQLAHGEFEAMVETDLKLSASTAQRLMAIARDGRLANPAHAQLLPPTWTTLYELTKLDDKTFEKAVEDRVIHPGIERKDVALLLKPTTTTKAKRRAANTKALKGKAPRWIDAANRAVAALEELKEIQDEYAEWRDNLPENLRESGTASKLETVADLDIESALSTAQEAANADLPLGFGRD